MIKFQNVSCEYERNTPVLKEVSFEINKGESVGLIGANGAGKSTIMKALLGLVKYEGNITVDGTRVETRTLPDIRKKIGFVLQNSDNQMFMPTVYDDMKFGPLNYGRSMEETEARIDEVLKALNIEYLKTKYNHKISGGEKRMAAIATVLAMEPEIVIMDEPSASLDPYNRRKVINAIKAMTETRIVASHDLDMIAETCTKVILVSNGEIAACGDCKTILHNKELLEANRLELPLGFA